MNPITIAVKAIRCLQENDFGPGSDEPYVLVTAVDLTAFPPNVEVTRYGPWEDVDTNEVHSTLTLADFKASLPGLPPPPVLFAASHLSRRPCWYLDNKTGKVIARPEDVILIVSMLEHDDGSPAGAQAFVKAAAVASLAASMNMSRSQRVHKLISDIDNALAGLTSFPDLGFFTPDDRIGSSKELVLQSSDLAQASQGSIETVLEFYGHSGAYRVRFELKNVLINAAVRWNDETAYFFVSENYYRYNIAADQVESGYPLPIAGHWPGLWSNGVDAAVVWNNGKAYFFKGAEYVRYDMAADQVDPGYPQPIAGHWPGLWSNGVDAAVVWNNGKAYFFKGAEYVRYDMATDQVDPGYPQPIAGHWSGLWSDGIDAGVVWNNGKAYFFKGAEYVRYDMAADQVDPGYPQLIVGNWPGLLE